MPYGKNLKKNTGETKKKNKSVKDWMDPEKAKSKKALDSTAKKVKTTPNKKLAKQYQKSEKKAHASYLKDREKSIKALKSGTQRGKAYASQHETRGLLAGRKLEKLKKKLGKKAKNKKDKK
jgi:hypothetical protein|tara:strand:- start:171 stop:533 length:363 start_codon:yes stop_codon:yes gene_type:complete